MYVKRIFLICLVLLVAAALVPPWWIGRDTEARYRALAASTAGSPAPFRLRVEAFDRGWFTSRATVSVEAASHRARSFIDALGAPREAGGLVLTDRIAHGLLPAPGPDGELAWRPGLAAVSGRLRAPGSPDSAPLARLAYRIGLDGGVVMVLDTPGAGIPAGEPGRTIGWRDLHVEAVIPPSPGPLSLRAGAAELGARHSLGRIILHGIEGRVDALLPESGLPTGSIELGAREAVVADANGPGTMGGAGSLALRIAFEGRGKQAGMTVEGSLDDVGSPRQVYGPGDLRLSVQGLDAGSLVRLIDSVTRIQARGVTGRAGTMALAGALLAEANALLAHGPVLELERLELAGPDGPVRATGRLELESTEPVVLNNPYLLQRAVKGTFEITVPPIAARHAALIHLRRNGLLAAQAPEAWLATQVSRGRLTRDGGDYQASVRLEQGRVLVNGRPWAELWR